VGRFKDIPVVQYHLGVVYAAAGNPAWAKYHLTAAADGAAAAKKSDLAAKAREAMGKLGK
jgi:hypothetical protein